MNAAKPAEYRGFRRCRRPRAPLRRRRAPVLRFAPRQDSGNLDRPVGIDRRGGSADDGPMLPLTKELEAKLGLELAAKRQEHADLDAAIDTLVASGTADQMLVQRLKKRRLLLKDRIVELEDILLPDIIA
jgi:hypothetical protein